MPTATLTLAGEKTLRQLSDFAARGNLVAWGLDLVRNTRPCTSLWSAASRWVRHRELSHEFCLPQRHENLDLVSHQRREFQFRSNDGSPPAARRRYHTASASPGATRHSPQARHLRAPPEEYRGGREINVPLGDTRPDAAGSPRLPEDSFPSGMQHDRRVAVNPHLGQPLYLPKSAKQSAECVRG